MQHLYLVDGSGFIFRAFHALPPMTKPDGVPVNAVYGFTTMVMKLLSDSDADGVAVIFDAARKTFRNDLHADYKANRPPVPEDLIPQFSLIRDATRAFNLPSIEQEGFEADDLIATYAALAVAQGIRVTIVSSDKDLMQLVGEGVSMLDPMKNRIIGPEEVKEKFGVLPDRVIDVQSLAGDSTDNVPGVPGIGIKTAAQLITEYGNLDTLLDRAGEIRQTKRRENLLEHRAMAELSRQLVTLRKDVPVTEALETFLLRPLDSAPLATFLREMGFKSILSRLPGPKLAAKPIVAAASSIVPSAEVKEVKYELVQTVEALDRWVEAAVQAGVVAIDTETTGLDPRHCDLVGVSLAVEPGRACYIPIRHDPTGGQKTLDLLSLGQPSVTAPPLIAREITLERLKRLGADASVLKVGHNIKYDLHVLANEGINLAPIDDTMLLSYVLDEGGHGLDALCLQHFNHTMIAFTDVCGSGKSKITFDQVPLDKALTYAAEDADYCLRLHRLLKPRLLAERMVTVYETLERPLIPLIKAMEERGIKVDSGILSELSQTFGHRMERIEADIQEKIGIPFNIASPQQLGKVLFEDLNLPGGKKTKTGQWATGAGVLEDLAASGHELPAMILTWRQFAKLKNTYTDALITQVEAKTGRVHTSFSLAATTTGRLSSSDPNLQNIPIRTEEGRRLRQAFIAEKGQVILSADYSQIELRLVAHVADIKALKQAFDEGDDIHAITASQVFGIPLAEMDADSRRRAKAINFGIIYGISAFGLSQQLSIPVGEAKTYIQAYFARYPEIQTYMERVKEEARRQGFVTTPFGRKVYIPGIADKSGAARAFAERAAINAPIQGGAADIIKRAMIRLPQELAERLLLQVHDELVFEVPQDEACSFSTAIKTVMEAAASLTVPLLVEVGKGASWGDAH